MFAKFYFLKPYLLLLLILLVAYLPLSSFYFGMKNDAFSDNFPDKYFLSEALHSGMLPLWNPYMNFGFPIYADMGFAFWNPITWLFAFVGYNAYSLTVEVLLYIYLAGLCMLRLAKSLKLSDNVSLVIAAMYMCSGFFTGCLQYINFLTSAAFLPLLLMAYLRLLKNPSLRNSVFLALSGYMVFAGGHPAIPVGVVYFLMPFSLLLFTLNKEYVHGFSKNIKFLGIAGLLFILLAIPAIYSYGSILDNYSIYSGQQNLPLADSGFNPLSYFSFFLPLVNLVKQGIFSNDIAMRNAYLSIAAIAAILISIKFRNRLSIVFFITGMLMLILSAGGNFKQNLYTKLPLLDYVRTSGEYRIFTILCFCLSAGFGLHIVCTKENALKLFINLLTYLKFILVALIIVVPIFYFKDFGSFFNTALSASPDPVSAIKYFYDAAPLQLLLFLNAFIAVALVWFIIFFLKRKNYTLFFLLIVADVIINAFLYLPATGIGQVTLPVINNIYNSNPKGVNIPELVAVNSIDTFDAKQTGLVGDASYYNKKIGTLKLTDYPSFLKSTETYFNSTAKDTVSQMPYVFLKSSVGNHTINSSVSVKEFRPTSIKINVSVQKLDTIVLLQNNYIFWKAFVNGKQKPVITIYSTFMGVALESGTNEIEFCYEDSVLTICFIISLVTLLFCIVYLIRTNRYSH